MNLKPFVYTAAVSLLGLAAACSSSDKSKTTDSETLTVAAEEVTPQDSVQLFPYSAEFFQNAERKGNGMDSTWAETKTGLKYAIIEQKEGPKPSATDAVTVQYAGQLTNGMKFDSSYDRPEPATFPLNQVIKGWTEGLQLMSVGSIYEFYIPSELGYGEQGMPPAGIPGGAPLMFRVELLKIGE